MSIIAHHIFNAFHLLLLSVGLHVAAQEASITIPPRAVNVSINEVAEFTCTAVGNSFAWEANGKQRDNEEEIIITSVVINGMHTSTFRMTVSSTDNATKISCIAFLLTPLSSDRSSPVILLVQGLLESVSELTVVSINSTTVLISWSPPFTLEGVPILGYKVTITNTVTSGENETMSVEGDTTMLYYSIDHPDPDNNFTVTLVPINGAGPGEPALVPLKFHIFEDSITTSKVSTEFTYSFLISPDAGNPIPTQEIATINQTISIVIPALITIVSCVVVLIVIVSTVTLFTCFLVLSKRRRISPPQNAAPTMSDNPAYEQVTLKSIAVQENSAYFIVHTVSPPPVEAQYENVVVCSQGKIPDYENINKN